MCVYQAHLEPSLVLNSPCVIWSLVNALVGTDTARMIDSSTRGRSLEPSIVSPCPLACNYIIHTGIHVYVQYTYYTHACHIVLTHTQPRTYWNGAGVKSEERLQTKGVGLIHISSNKRTFRPARAESVRAKFQKFMI